MLNLATISLDGSMIVAFPSPTPAAPGASHQFEYWTPALGSWSPVNATEANLTFMALGADESGAPIGSHVITSTISASGDGQSWSGPFTIKVLGPDGAALGSASGTVSATRITAWVAALT
jgi:hypothetical protein